MTRQRALWTLMGVAAVSVLSALGAIRAMRPERPNLANSREWTLIKIDKSASSPREIRVYVLKHLSNTWDPYTVEQNRIVVEDGTKSQFLWPSEREYAAGWCEIVRMHEGGVAVLLFESASSLRVVFLDQGEFSFRPDKDELLASTEIDYAGVTQEGVLQLTTVEAGKTRNLKWTPVTGFAEASISMGTETRLPLTDTTR